MPGAVLSEVVGLLSLGSVLFCELQFSQPRVLTTFPIPFFPLGPHAEALLPFLDYHFQIYTHARTRRTRRVVRREGGRAEMSAKKGGWSAAG